MERMERMEIVRTRLTSSILEDLQSRVARMHTVVPRLRAEADTQYPTSHPMLNYLFGYHAFIEVLAEDLAGFLDELQDSWDATSTKGKLSYSTKVERRDRLSLEIAMYEAQNQSPTRRASR